MATRRNFLKGGTAAATGIVFCSCGLLERAHAQGTGRTLPVAVNGKSPQRRYAVDVNEVAGAREAECHDRHQALAAGEHASVLTGNLGQGADRLVDGRGRVVLKWRGLHRSSPRTRWASTITADCPIFGNLSFFWIDAQLLVYVKNGTQFDRQQMKPPPFR